VVLVVFLLGAVQHEVLAAAFQVTLGGLFHSSKIQLFQILRILRNGFCVIFLKKHKKSKAALLEPPCKNLFCSGIR
jgi:hypothetical protein